MPIEYEGRAKTPAFHPLTTGYGGVGILGQQPGSWAPDPRFPRSPCRVGFGERENPVLGTVAVHTGVDWKGSFGAEVRAAGDGVVDKAGWHGAYRRYVRLRHADDYMTAYAHLSQFAPQIVPGARVRQGDMIGTVGSTGISSGPHLHYELLVSGRFVDPMRARLPHVRVLNGAELAAFAKERDSLDALLRDKDCDPGTAGIRNFHSDRGYDLTCGHFIGERP
jgi:murein DD-endopeptidase MepM/ murein hydrolase activator NlpD